MGVCGEEEEGRRWVESLCIVIKENVRQREERIENWEAVFDRICAQSCWLC